MLKKRRKILAIVLGLIYLLGLTGCGKEKEKSLAELNTECTIVEEKDITLETETNGTANIVVKIPDYSALYAAAMQSDDFEKFIIDSLKQGDYSTVEYQDIANVTVSDGKMIVHSDVVVKKIIERELINAVNSISEG